MFMLGLGPIAVVHSRTDTSFSAREIASDYWCRPIIDCLLYTSTVYSQKFSRDPIFAQRQYAKISRSNFRGWAIQVYSENVRLGFYFADLIFVVCQSTAKIGSLENFRLYGI